MYKNHELIWSIFITMAVLAALIVFGWMIGNAVASARQQGFDQQIACIKAGGTPAYDSSINGILCRK